MGSLVRLLWLEYEKENQKQDQRRDRQVVYFQIAKLPQKIPFPLVTCKSTFQSRGLLPLRLIPV